MWENGVLGFRGLGFWGFVLTRLKGLDGFRLSRVRGV